MITLRSLPTQTITGFYDAAAAITHAVLKGARTIQYFKGVEKLRFRVF